MAKRNGMTAAEKHTAAHKARRAARDQRCAHVVGAAGKASPPLPRVNERGYMGTGSFMFADAAGELYIANTEHGTISRPTLV